MCGASVSAYLVSVQVDYHGGADTSVFILEQVLYKQCDVCVWTEASALVGAAVVEAPANVDGPASLQSQSPRQDSTSCLDPVNSIDLSCSRYHVTLQYSF